MKKFSLAAVLMLVAVGQAKAVFDLNADWSDLINPNGVWT
jgi:hypothetical protein